MAWRFGTEKLRHTAKLLSLSAGKWHCYKGLKQKKCGHGSWDCGSNKCLLLFYTIIIHRGLPIVVFVSVEAGSFIVVKVNKTPISRCGQIMELLITDVERSLEVSNAVYGCKITHTLWNRVSKSFSCLQTCPLMDTLLIQVVHGELSKHRGISARSYYHHCGLRLLCFCNCMSKEDGSSPKAY